MMTIAESMRTRHAVRKFQEKIIENEKVEILQKKITKCNEEANLAIQLILNDKNTIKGFMPYLAGFRNVANYIAIVSSSDKESEEKAGYYGQSIVLLAQRLGLNTCWIGATFKRDKCKAQIEEGRTLMCVIALGYGTSQGEPHKSKNMPELCKVDRKMPVWFRNGMEAAMLAPTANNKQDFIIELSEDQVKFERNDEKFSNINLGIVKYHFEIGKSLSHEHLYTL